MRNYLSCTFNRLIKTFHVLNEVIDSDVGTQTTMDNLALVCEDSWGK